MKYPISIIILIIMSLGIVTAIPYNILDYYETTEEIMIGTQSITVTCIATPISAYSPLNVVFTSQVNGGTGSYTYTWIFGDGHISSSTNIATHIYDTGTYTPTLTITDSNNNQATTSCGTINAIKPVTPITASCTVTPTNGIIPFSTTLDVQVTGGAGMFAYTWNFGDGNTQTNGQNIQTYMYNTAGTYNPIVTIKDCLNNQVTINCGTINAITPITASCIATPVNGHSPLNVQFTSQVSGGSGNYNYKWTFGDGYISNGTNTATHVYNTGTYYTTLTVTDCNNNEITVNCGTITTTAPLTATCASIPTSGYAPLDVKILVTTSGGTGSYSYIYNYGPQSFFSENNTGNYIYTDIGTYTPNVVVSDYDGNIVTANCGMVFVNDDPNYVLISNPGGPYTSYINEKILFDASASTSSLGIVNYRWNFGDGTMIDTFTPTISHIYTKINIYNVSLTVFDTKGHSDLAYTSATVLEHSNYKNDTFRDVPDKGLYIKQLTIYGQNCEILAPDDDITVYLRLKNDWNRRLENVRVTVSIPEYGFEARSTIFDIGKGDEEDVLIVLPVYDLPSGAHYVRITITNDDNGEQVRRIKYREILVGDNNQCDCNCKN